MIMHFCDRGIEYRRFEDSMETYGSLQTYVSFVGGYVGVGPREGIKSRVVISHYETAGLILAAS